MTLSNTLQSEGRTPIMYDDLFQDEAKLRIMREPGGVAIYKTTCGLEWPCVKGKGGHEFLRGVPVTRGDTGIGIDVKALPRDVQQLDMTTGEHGHMFRQSQQKPGETVSVTHVGESSWRGSPRDSVHEGGKKVTVEKSDEAGTGKSVGQGRDGRRCLRMATKVRATLVEAVYGKDVAGTPTDIYFGQKGNDGNAIFASRHGPL